VFWDPEVVDGIAQKFYGVNLCDRKIRLAEQDPGVLPHIALIRRLNPRNADPVFISVLRLTQSNDEQRSSSPG